LLQKGTDGQWIFRTPVARISEDAVANVHQGAIAVPAQEVLPPAALERARSLAHESAIGLDNACEGPVIELGIDLLFDSQFSPWILEVNSRPSGRLAALCKTAPDIYEKEAQKTAIQPLLSLAGLA